ncbi:MAG TPA: DUF3667 domain-containing protein [Flavobacteriales bacterium]
MIRCLNCDRQFEGVHCPSCAQPAKTGRITGAYLAHDIPHSVLHVDRGILFTMKELFICPAAMLRGYLAGKRAGHFKPVAYVVILSAASSFVAHLVGNYVARKHGVPSMILDDTWMNRAIMGSRSIFGSYPSLFYFAMIPIISACNWLFFHRRYNFWEHVVINAYLTAQFNLLLIVAAIIRLLGDDSYKLTPYLILFFTYLAVVYSKLFLERRDPLRLPKIIALILMVGVLYMTGLTFGGIMTPWWI